MSTVPVGPYQNGAELVRRFAAYVWPVGPLSQSDAARELTKYAGRKVPQSTVASLMERHQAGTVGRIHRGTRKVLTAFLRARGELVDGVARNEASAESGSPAERRAELAAADSALIARVLEMLPAGISSRRMRDEVERIVGQAPDHTRFNLWRNNGGVVEEPIEDRTREILTAYVAGKRLPASVYETDAAPRAEVREALTILREDTASGRDMAVAHRKLAEAFQLRTTLIARLVAMIEPNAGTTTIVDAGAVESFPHPPQVDGDDDEDAPPTTRGARPTRGPRKGPPESPGAAA